MPNIVTEYGVGGAGSLENLGQKPLVLSTWLRGLLTAAVFAAGCYCVAAMLNGSRAYRTWQVKCPSWQTLLTLLAPFTAAYLALLLPRALFDIAVDRYFIPLVALFLIPLVRFYQERIQARVPIYCFGVLAVFAAYGVASTHDYFATNRARLKAVTLVERSGVPRTAVQGGWESDGWTQIERRGYINDARLQRPSGAYQPAHVNQQLPQACQFWYSDYTPVIQPKYFVVFSPVSCLAGSPFGPVSYQTWLPPFQRNIYIQQLP